MSDLHWRAPITAPKDGAMVILLTATGVHAGRWGSDLPGGPGWSCPYTDDWLGANEDEILGWVPCPEVDFNLVRNR